MGKFGSAYAAIANLLGKSSAAKRSDKVAELVKAADEAVANATAFQTPVPSAPAPAQSVGGGDAYGVKALYHKTLSPEQQIGLTHALSQKQVIDAGHYYASASGKPLTTGELAKVAQSWVELHAVIGLPLKPYEPTVHSQIAYEPPPFAQAVEKPAKPPLKKPAKKKSAQPTHALDTEQSPTGVPPQSPAESDAEYAARLEEMGFTVQWLEDGDFSVTGRAAERQGTDALRGGFDNITEYLTNIRNAANDPNNLTDTKHATAALEAALRHQLQRGEVSQDYLDYLRFHGVDARTIDAVQSGALPMDKASRLQRARDMGLDTEAVWYRLDRPLKSDFKGWTGAALNPAQYRRSKSGSLGFLDLEPSREGLVYASHRPELAARGAQMPENVRHEYMLFGPRDGIAGIDSLPPESYSKFSAALQSAMLRKVSDPADRRRMARRLHLAEPLVEVRQPFDSDYPEGQRDASLGRLRGVDDSTDTQKLADRTIPLFGTAENRKLYTEPLMASGAKGTLVRDETGLATAFTPAGARMLRRADLAPFDPRFAKYRNILQGVAVPIATGGLLDGLRDSREQSR